MTADPNFPGEFIPALKAPGEPLVTDAEFEAAAEDPEFNSVEPTVVLEVPQGAILSDGTVQPREIEALRAEAGWLERVLVRFLGCK